MKKVLNLLLVIFLLTGCTGEHQELEQVMQFRASLLSGTGCSFQTIITADYGDEIYQFSLDCFGDENGNLYFAVLEPQSISGISGNVDATGGKLTFDNEKVLAFKTMADGQITPISSPWLMLKALRGGYITSCGLEDQYIRVSIDDSYENDPLRLDIWFSDLNTPINAEVLWEGRRILSLEIKNFEIL